MRARWWELISQLSPADARASLLQMLIDIDEHWAREHEEDGLPEDLGIPPDEYLTRLIERVRAAPPPESSQSIRER